MVGIPNIAYLQRLAKIHIGSLVKMANFHMRHLATGRDARLWQLSAIPHIGMVGIVSACLCTGCASGVSPVEETFRFLGSRNAAAENAVLSASHKYLRVVVDGKVALLAQGYLEPHPKGAIEIWYSAHGEVLKLHGGRIVGTAGLATDWRDIRNPDLPKWQSVTDIPSVYEREHDEMPGYRMGIREKVRLRAIPPPTDTSLRNLVADRLSWFEERVEVLDGEREKRPSRYAIELLGIEERVVYGEHCLSEDLCLSWQRWPAGK